MATRHPVNASTLHDSEDEGVGGGGGVNISNGGSTCRADVWLRAYASI